jgi:copper chaperone CopZ
MTCSGCVAKTKDQLLAINGINSVDVQLAAPQATITMRDHVSLETLQSALNKVGKFFITEADNGMEEPNTAETLSWFTTYKPVILIFAYLTLAGLLIELSGDRFSWMKLLQNFMAGFFLVFSFFKLLDIKGFAESYATYDIIAKRWMEWGYIYAFIELGLGVAYLVNFEPVITNVITIMVMGVSIIGVLQSVLNKRKIKCACLGAVFNLPMSTITIIEDALMLGMSLIMIIALF